MEANADSSSEAAVISLPKGGGAVSGLGETFSPDLFTGTGSFSVPIELPPGRVGLAPQLSLGYSTGSGGGVFGLGWQLSLPGVTRKTARGIPRYVDAAAPAEGGGSGGTFSAARTVEDAPDVFLLSGAEDLVPVSGSYPGRMTYRPRTEGLFARIEHVHDDSGDYWEVRAKSGLLTRYGTARPAEAGADWSDPAVVRDPDDPARIFGWRISQTRDPMGNLIRYEYGRDQGQEPGHHWDQPLLARISYADHGDRKAPSFLIQVDFEYEARPDPSSDHRAGFELRTSLRCRLIRVSTQAADGLTRIAREYRLGYQQAAFNGVSLLTRVDVVGIDEASLSPEHPQPTESLPPVTFGYSDFSPAGRRFEAVAGAGLPPVALSDPTLALIDLRGNGLPDLIELGAEKRIWRNAGAGRFELPRGLSEAPSLSLADPGVQFMDANGDGRADLVVSAPAQTGGTAGYFPLTFASGWSRRSFRRYEQVPSVALTDPSVKMIDLDGDGLTDVLFAGSQWQTWFNDPDPHRAWQRTGRSRGLGPDVDLADPRVRLADMTGDGLQDIVLLHNGSIVYWPNRGHGRWGAQVTMRRAPRLPDGYDQRRLLLGDVDGDGVADLVYVDFGRVLLWGNQSGNAWSDPITVAGTPAVADTDDLRLADLNGTGMAGVLFSRGADGSGRPHLRFLDLTGAIKPYLLRVMDNHLGAVTTVTYASSTQEYLRDEATPERRWRTTLPFPVHVVSHVEVLDAISGGRLTSEFRYHHGYWDGVEREFRGFAMVEQLDTEAFDPGPGTGTLAAAQPTQPAQARPAQPHAQAVDPEHFSPPTLTRSWFHPGPVAADEADDWTELDLRHEYCTVDTPMLERPAQQVAFLAGLSRADRRAALRTLRGQLLRSELYALDDSDRRDRPYTVVESLSGVEQIGGITPTFTAAVSESVFFPFSLGRRTTQYERGDEPMTRFSLPVDYDGYGIANGQIELAVARGRDPRVAGEEGGAGYLATYTTTDFARRDDEDHYLVDRIARTTTVELVNDGRLPFWEMRDRITSRLALDGVVPRVIAHRRTFYDGEAFTGLPLQELGEYGLPVRTETLAFTDGFLDGLFGPASGTSRPVYLGPPGQPWPAEYPAEFREQLAPLAGYTLYRDDDLIGSPGGYYVVSGRHRYDVHEPDRVPRGLLLACLDPLGARSAIEYDEHDLLPVRTVDAVGLSTTAVNDFRLLRPAELTDVNGNASSVTFSPIGLVTGLFVRGKDGEGDREQPGVTLTYDLFAFADRGEPVSVRSDRRAHHDTETGLPPEERDDVIVSVQFSDGFGRVLQTRSQAEDLQFGDPSFGGSVIGADQSAPVPESTGRERAPGDPENVVVSGWQIYDNKGRVVQKYEPFFATGFGYATPGWEQLGQRSTLFYDPRGAVIRTVNPDGSEQRVLFGVPEDLTDPDRFTPTPWEAYTYDANDNAGRTHGFSAEGYAGHWNTPSSIEVDALGRTVRTTIRNGPAEEAASTWFTTSTGYDIQGTPLSITDGLGRTAFGYTADLVRRVWRTDSIDAGRRDAVFDGLGRVIETRDSKGAITLRAFDRLQRPVRVWAREVAGDPTTLRQRIEYGDGGSADQRPEEREAARSANLLGRAVRHYDEAGLSTTLKVDFRGNTVETSRRVIADDPVLATYGPARTNNWDVRAFRIDWAPAPGQDQDHRDAELLETTAYTSSFGYDALNRLVHKLFPAEVDGHRAELSAVYSRAGTLEQVHLDGAVQVRRIAYDARGRRALIAYGNGVMTRYAYDPQTARLTRMRSEPFSSPDPLTFRPAGVALQDYGYDYDLVGNLLTLRDRTPGSGLPATPDALDRQFSYDPVYRLLSASGRESQQLPSTAAWTDLPRGTDVTTAQPYQEKYRYDAAGSLLELVHAGTGGFTRQFTVEAGSNRLQRMTVGGTSIDYTVDATGNRLSETTTRHFGWNHSDQLVVFATQVKGSEPSLHAQYLYDAAGQRVKKLVRRQGGAVEVTHYLDGTFEHHRWAGGANNHVHVMDDNRRVALLRHGPAHPDDRGPATAVHLGDHLASSTVVLDESGALVNREEYTPYGETSFGSFARKRYRFTGRERDEESGLSLQGARYYAPWSARWISADPAGVDGGVNLFAYAAGNPMQYVDPHGTEPEEPPMVGHEIIVVTGTAPQRRDNYGSAVTRGLSAPLPTEEQFKNDLAAEVNSTITEGSPEQANQATAWGTDPVKAQADWDKYARSQYFAFSEKKIDKLEHQQRAMAGALPFIGITFVGSALAAGAAFAPPCLVVAGEATGVGSTGAGVFAAVAHSITFWKTMSGSEGGSTTMIGATSERKLSPDQVDAAIRMLGEGQDVHVETFGQLRQIQVELGQLGLRPMGSGSIIPMRTEGDMGSGTGLMYRGEYRAEGPHGTDSLHGRYSHINIILRGSTGSPNVKVAVIATGTMSEALLHLRRR